VQQDGNEQLKIETRKQTGQQFGFCIYTGSRQGYGLWAAVLCHSELRCVSRSYTHTVGLKKLDSTKRYTAASDWNRRLGRT